jgi:penicillin G amidase
MSKRLLPVALLLVAAACSDGTSTPSPPQGAVPGSGVASAVLVSFDADGVPHLKASSDTDAAFALGWIHARDRLFQMDFLRRAARGRLAEMLGPDAISTDVSIRTLFTTQSPVPSGAAAGSHRIEDAIAVTLPADVRASLESYAAGVTRYIHDMRANAAGTYRPAEYAALDSALAGGYAVPDWTVEDSLAVGRLQTWLLSETIGQETGFGQVAQGFLAACGGNPVGCAAFGLFADLTRSAPAAQAFILPDAGVNRTTTLQAGVRAEGLSAALAQASELVDRSRGLLGREPAGSNNWVLRPSVASGSAIVANDPHLSLANPANFHLAHVTTPTRNVGGVAFPGTGPVFLIGHNDRIGWGATVAGYDVTDVFYFPESGAGGPPVLPPGVVPVTIPERFSVRGQAAATTVPVTVVPGYGPLVAHAGGLYLTARWTGQEPSLEADAFFRLNAAGSVDEAFAALAKFEVGAQNFVIADVDGNIGYDPHAYVPVRKAGCWTATNGVVPWAPMPGWNDSCAWVGRIPDADLPQAKNPPANRLVTANNDITGVTAGNQPLSRAYYLYPMRDLGYRAARIEALLSAKASGYTMDDMTSIQADSKSLFAADLVPALLAWYQSRSAEVTARGLDGAVALLQHWADPANPQSYRTPTGLATSSVGGAASPDGEVRAAASASMLFHALVPRLAQAILDPSLAAVTVAGAPLTSIRLAGLVSDQLVAKYLAALAATSLGHAPAVPLNTGLGACGASCADRAVAALDETVRMLADPLAFGSTDPSTWLWGRKHRIYFRSNLAQAGVTLFDYGPLANDGGLYTVDVANFSWSDAGPDGFVQANGANVRFVAEMTAGAVKWRAVLPGDEADNVGDPAYMSMVPAYLSNAPGNQPWTDAEVAAATVATLEFRP